MKKIENEKNIIQHSPEVNNILTSKLNLPCRISILLVIILIIIMSPFIYKTIKNDDIVSDVHFSIGIGSKSQIFTSENNKEYFKSNKVFFIDAALFKHNNNIKSFNSITIKTNKQILFYNHILNENLKLRCNFILPISYTRIISLNDTIKIRSSNKTYYGVIQNIHKKNNKALFSISCVFNKLKYPLLIPANIDKAIISYKN